QCPLRALDTHAQAFVQTISLVPDVSQACGISVCPSEDCAQGCSRLGGDARRQTASRTFSTESDTGSNYRAVLGVSDSAGSDCFFEAARKFSGQLALRIDQGKLTFGIAHDCVVAAMRRPRS